MVRSSTGVVAAAVLLTVAACSSPGGPDDRSAARSSSQAPLPRAILWTDVPQGLAVPEGFDTSGGFALHTVVGGNAIDGVVRDTWELLPRGIASYGTDATGQPIVELTTLDGASRWHHPITNPLTHDDPPALTPSLLSVTEDGTTWVVLVERGTEPGGRSDVMRLTSWDAATGEPGGTAVQAGADHGVSTESGSIAITVLDPNDGPASIVVMDPATGRLTTNSAIPGGNADYAWNETVVGSYQGEPVYRRECTGIFTAESCPSGYYFRGQPVSPHGALGGPSWGLVVTPGGTLLGDVDLGAGRQLPLQCSTSARGVPTSPSGRYAIVRGNVIDFHAGTAACLGTYPYWSAITDDGAGYGWLEDTQPAQIDLSTGAGTVTPLPADTALPLGIADGGLAIFAVDAPGTGGTVIVLPPA